jgi:hypothetical protein
MQQFLKPTTRTAGTGIIATEFFEQLFVAVNDADAAFDVGFRRESPSTFAGSFAEKRIRQHSLFLAYIPRLFYALLNALIYLWREVKPR